MMHEVHIACRPQARALRRLRRALPDLRPNRNCDPANIPENTLCYEYPRGREAEFEIAARGVGLQWEWGVGGTTMLCCAAVGDYLYAADDAGFFFVWDISDPENPDRTGFNALNLGDTTSSDIVPYHGLVYVFTSERIFTIDVDDPANPSLKKTTLLGGEAWVQGAVVGDTIFAAGNNISWITTDLDTEGAGLTTEDEPTGLAGIAIQGRRIFSVTAAGILANQRIGGTYCPFIKTGAVVADEINTELLSARHLRSKGEIVASSIGAAGGNSEEDTGVVYASNYMKIGQKFIFVSQSVADPNTIFTATLSSLFLASDGTVWRNTDGATAWTAM